MAIDYTGNDITGDKNPEGLAQNAGGPLPVYRPGLLRQQNPALPVHQSQIWVNPQTGESFQGSLAYNDPTQVIAEGGTGPEHKTTQYDINTGKKVIQNEHPWWDAAKNAAMIFGGSETAGLLSAFGGGAGAASAASGGSSAAGGSGAIAPSVAAGGAAGGGGAAAVGVGGTLGTLGKWLPIVQGVTATVGGIEAGRRQGQILDAQLAERQNADAIEIARQKALSDAAQVNQQISQKVLQTGDYQRNLKNAIQAGLLDPTNGVQDINFNLPDRIASHMGTVTGGLRPSAISNRGAISAAVGPQALEALKHNPTTNDLLPPAGNVSPNLTPYPSASGLDTGLGIASLVGSGLSAFSSLWPKPSSPIMGGNVTPPPITGSFAPPAQTGTNPLYTVPGATQPQAFNFMWPQRGLGSGVNFYG